MHLRQFAFLATGTLALTLFGCAEDPPPAGFQQTSKAPAAATAKPAATGAAPTAAANAAPAAVGNGVIKGVVNFTGKAPEMKVPAKRKEAEFCKTKEVKYNAVVANGGKLKDVFVRIEVGGVKGNWKAPETAAVVNQVDCMYEPRIQGVVSGQKVDIKNSDATLHNVHTFKGAETLFNQAQPKGSDAISKEWEDENAIIKFTCDVHPWMRGFVVVTDHPFFAVSGDDGTFTIEKLPAGKYNVEAWHSQYGLKKASVEVTADKPAELTFTYDGTEAEPAENKEELKGLW